MASCGFVCNLLCFRNCQKKGERHDFVYPTNAKQLERMGAPWMTKALRASGSIGAGMEVTNMTCTTVGTPGLLSELRLVTLEYSGGSADAPTRLMAKFAPPDLKTRATTDLFELIRCEYNCYKGDMLKNVPLKTPKCYFADMNYKTNNCCILLEVVDGTFKDQLAGVSLEDARKVMGALAKFHGVWFGGAKIEAPEVQFINRLDRPLYKLLGPGVLKGLEEREGPEAKGQGLDLRGNAKYARSHTRHLQAHVHVA